MAKPSVGAVILAAGLSSRMGSFKPLLKIGEMAIIERVISLFSSAGVDELVTVVGHRSAEITTLLQAAPIRIIRNDRYEDGMFSSIQRGLETLDNSCDCFFLHPVDIPLVQPATVTKLLQTYRDNPAIDIFYPVFRGRKGHPPLLSTRLKEMILAYEGKDGMRGFLRPFRQRSQAVQVEDPAILMDADTPEDYQRLQFNYQLHGGNTSG